MRSRFFVYLTICLCGLFIHKGVTSDAGVLAEITELASNPSTGGFDDLTLIDHSENGMFTSSVRPFLEDNCLRCHGPDKEKGGLRVDLLVADLDDHYSLSHYQNIIDELIVENMPPEEEPQPDGQKVVEVINILTELIEAAKERYSFGGGRPVRRLTRTEFIYTVWDQLGIYINDDDLPDDMLAGSFENNAELLFTTDMHLQVYLEKARGIVNRFIASRSEKPGTYEVPVKYPQRLKQSLFLFDTSNVPAAGFLSVRTAWWQRESKRSNQIVIGPAEEPIEHEVTGTRYSPQLIDFNVFEYNDEIKWDIKRSNVQSKKMSKVLSEQENAKRTVTQRKLRVNKDTLVQAQELDSLHPVILGGVKNMRTVSRQPYEFFEPFLREGENLPDSAAPVIIEKFAALVKRGRPVDPEFVQKLNVIFEDGRAMGMPFWEALEEPLAVSMCSIDSIMLFEDRDPAKPSRTISGVELANRLSYTLWRSAPDSELINLGRSAQLLDEEVKAAQIRRMLEDVKFGRFAKDFTIQWFELARQKEIAVDQRVYQSFDHSVQPLMIDETVQFMSYVLRNNLSLSNLIDSDFMVLNNMLARHYGIKGVYGPHFRPVPRTGREADRMRGGVLTHAGILMQGSTGDRTSIVERGAFIARKLIDKPPAPPPPDAGELPVDDLNTSKMTAAELVKLHASSPQCANCHAGIDPLGMGLEEFDVVGLYRDMESRLNPAVLSFDGPPRRFRGNRLISVPLDSEGFLYDGQTFDGVAQMKQVLMSKKDDLARGYIKAIMTYSNGREASLRDGAIIDSILAKTSAGGFPSRSIIEEVMRSKMLTSY